jgi:hypothetical protein
MATDNSKRLFDLWKKNSRLSCTQSRYMNRMRILWNVQMTRKAFRTWGSFMTHSQQHEASEAISGHVTDKKQMRRDAKSMKAGLDQEIEMRDTAITQNYNQIGQLNKRLGYMLAKNVSN